MAIDLQSDFLKEDLLYKVDSLSEQTSVPLTAHGLRPFLIMNPGCDPESVKHQQGDSIHPGTGQANIHHVTRRSGCEAP